MGSRMTVVLLCAAGLVLAGCNGQQPSEDSAHKSPAVSGQLVFVRGDPSSGASSAFILDLAEGHPHKLFGRGANLPHWSPSGTMISIFCCDDGMAAHLIDWPSARFHELAPADRTLETHCGPWSSDGQRLACGSFGTADPKLNGIYSVRVSDGRGVERVTANPMGEDTVGDYSPDGRRMVFVRQTPAGKAAIYLVKIGEPRTVRQISPPRLVVDGYFGGAWSPAGEAVLFVAQPSLGRLRSIWLADTASGRVQQVAIARCGGDAADSRSADCFDPAWSPDGRKIVFTQEGETGSDLFIANRNGTDLTRVTRTGDASQADWHR